MTLHSKTTLDDYLDIPTFLKRYPQFKLGQLRWLVVKKKENGLDKSLKRLGRKLYFHVPSVIALLESQDSSPINLAKNKKDKV